MLAERSSKTSRSVIIILTGGIILLYLFLIPFFGIFGMPASASYHFFSLMQTTLIFLVSFLTLFSVGFHFGTLTDSIGFVIVATLGSIAGLHFFVAKQILSGKIQKKIIRYAFVIFDLLVILAFFLGFYFLFFPMVSFNV